MEFERKLQEDLHKYLLAEGRIDAKFPECPDVEDLWQSVVKAYLPDGFKEYQEYPVTSLGWVMFIGMALAKYWDEDWEKYSKDSGETLYKNLRDARGYDSMDDYILEDVLGLKGEEKEKVTAIVGECAARTYSALQHSDIEPGTKEAVNAYISALHALYVAGMAMELYALGYKMTPMNMNMN